MNTPTKSLGILVARLIVRGDVDRARREAAGRLGWSVVEARAIIGACRFVNTRHGAHVSFTQFCGG